MRVWDLPPKKLCREHLLGEHREFHTIWLVHSDKKQKRLFPASGNFALEGEVKSVILEARFAGT